MAVLWCAVAVFIGTWYLYTPSILWLQMFASGLIAFIGAGYWTIMGSIGADVMDYDELECGRRREGSFAACGSWINKFGMAVGAGFGFFILDWIGFDSKLTIQTPHTIFMIRFLLAAIPIIGLFLALVGSPASRSRRRRWPRSDSSSKPAAARYEQFPASFRRTPETEGRLPAARRTKSVELLRRRPLRIRPLRAVPSGPRRSAPSWIHSTDRTGR